MVVDGVTYSAPTYFYEVPFSTEYDVWPGQERFTGPYKHLYWQNSATQYLLQKNVVVPPMGPGQTYTETAGFTNAYAATTQVHFVDGTTSGSVKFHDPWYLGSGDHTQPDAFLSFSSPYHPNGSYAEQSDAEGVFLNKYPDPDNSSKPYYSMRVPHYLTAATKQPKSLPLSVGDWVCYGIFPTTKGDAEVTYDYHKQAAGKFTRAIEFKVGDATLVAEYHGHLCSKSNQLPSKANNQRKVARQYVDGYNPWGGEIHHNVYESQGKIFYTKSTDDGSSWSPEELVSDYYAEEAVRPSISVTYQGLYPYDYSESNDALYVTYIEDGDVVVMQRMNSQLGDQLGWQEIDRTSTGYSYHGAPVVCSFIHSDYTPGCLVIWEDVNKLKYSIYKNQQPYDDGQTTYQALDFAIGHVVNRVQLQPRSPSLDVLPEWDTGPINRFAVCWREGQEVYLQQMALDGSGYSSHNPTIARDVQTGNPIKSDAVPSLAFHDTEPAITYEAAPTASTSLGIKFPVATILTTIPIQLGGRTYFAVGSPYPNTLHTGAYTNRMIAMSVQPSPYWSTSGYKGDWWSFVSTRFTSNGFNPSIGSKYMTGLMGFNPEIKVFFNDFAGEYGSLSAITTGPKQTATNAPVFTHVGTGSDPNTHTSGVYALDVHSSTHSAPFNFELGALGFQKATVLEMPIMIQGIVSNQDSAFAKYGVLMPRLHVTPTQYGLPETYTNIDWVWTRDSLGYGELGPFEGKSQTESFTVPANSDLEYATEMFAFMPGNFDTDFSFDLKFYKASNDSLLMVDNILLSQLPSDSAMYVVTSVNLSSLTGETVYMTLGLSDTTSDYRYGIEYVMSLDDPGYEKGGNTVAAIPSEITLANYPNPFNPSTDITYGIPEETHVKLAVYDNLGRVVKVLANGWKPAGTYTVTFDAADLPSGMYLYRIETAKGSVSKKMLLMK